jgi:hypothetical protein
VQASKLSAAQTAVEETKAPDAEHLPEGLYAAINVHTKVCE